MAWNKALPANNELLSATPAEIRANWDAIELLTESALQITNAKVAAAAGIVDTKLAQITTASKVHGSSLTGLASIPAGAGVIPSANIGITLPVSTANGGTGSTANANAASGVVVLNASSQLPAVSGALLTGISITKATLGIDSGTFTSVTEGNQAVSFNFTFASAPIVVCNAYADNQHNEWYFYISSVSTTGFNHYNRNGSAVTFSYIAIGTPA